MTWSKVLGWQCLGGAEKWGQGRPPGGWRYRHHFRNKTKTISSCPPLCLVCMGAGCSLAVQESGPRGQLCLLSHLRSLPKIIARTK